jgi:hypothetical protein
MPKILWNLKVHYRVHWIPPLVPVANKTSPAHIHTTYSSRFILIFILTSARKPHKWSRLRGFSTKMLYVFLISRVLCVLHAPPTSSSLIRWPWEYLLKSTNYEATSLCVLLYLPAASYLPSSNVYCSHTPSIYNLFFPSCERPNFTSSL